MFVRPSVCLYLIYLIMVLYELLYLDLNQSKPVSQSSLPPNELLSQEKKGVRLLGTSIEPFAGAQR